MSSAEPRTVANSETSSGSRRLVLVVEDNEKNARLLTAMLESAGYSIGLAGDGIEGLRLAISLHPALVLTDLQMPGMDGLELTRTLRANSETAAIPVIAVTAHVLDEHRLAALEAGCCSYLTKPIRYQTLLSEVANALDRG